MKTAAVLAWVAVVLAASGGLAQDDADAEDWTPLFNGRDLGAWTVKIRGYEAGDNFGGTFRVEDGLLTVGYDAYAAFDDRFGHIFFREPYSHYRLIVEYRFTGESVPGAPEWARRNSGVMLHSQAPETMPAAQNFPVSVEVQFLGGFGDGQPRSTANMCSPGTHIVYQGRFTSTHCIESASETYDGDQWVTVEVLVLGNERFVHFVNGDPVMEYGGTTVGGGAVAGHRPEAKPDGHALSDGYIALQSEGHPIEFRRVELLNLEGCMDPAATNFRSYYVEADPEACRY